MALLGWGDHKDAFWFTLGLLIDRCFGKVLPSPPNQTDYTEGLVMLKMNIFRLEGGTSHPQHLWNNWFDKIQKERSTRKERLQSCDTCFCLGSCFKLQQFVC